MQTAFPAFAAWVFLPFVLPLCFYAAFTDLKEMKITNQMVIALAVVFVVVGPVALDLSTYGAGLIRMAVVLVAGIVLTAVGAMGAGDAKFMAAAAGFIMPADLQLVVLILSANLLAAVVTHRLAKFTPLRRIVPDWKSWDAGRKFPMGLSLGTSLAIYLGLAAAFGS